MTSNFKPLTLPPGVVAQATKKMGSTNYAEVNMVRWVEGQLAPIGGQSRYDYTFASRCKAIHGWYDLSQAYHVAYLCESNLYVDTGGSITDITPTDGIKPPTSPTQGGYGDGFYSENVILAAGAAWNVGATTITMAVANPGSVFPGQGVYNTSEHPVDPPPHPPTPEVGVVSTYVGTTLTLAAPATEAGFAGDVLNFDWYGGPRAIGSDAAIDRVPDAYSINNFGAILLCMTSADGRLLFWNPAGVPGTKAAVVPPKVTTPACVVPNGRCFVVTPERFVQIFGSYNDGTANDGGSFRRMAWCDQEDYTNWNYSDTTTQAGFIDIEPASPIICALATRNGTLFWTGKKCYVSKYLGIPYVFNFTELADNCTPWSPQSMVTTSSMALWFSQQGPYSFDGTSILPIQCMARAWIDDDIDLLQVREQACAVHVSNFNEFWWFFPQGPQTNPSGYNSRAVIYNYKEGWWSQGRIARSAGVTASYTSHTVMANGTSAFEHEYLNQYNDCDLPWIETFDLYLDSGFHLTTVKQLIPDIEGALNNVLYSLFYRNSRSVGLQELQTTPRIVRNDGYVDFRTTGRDIRMRIDLAVPPGQIVNGVASNGSVLPVTVGQHLIDSVPRGDR
jgi:hypothetical protein